MDLKARHVLFLASLRGEPQSVESREKEGKMGRLKVGQKKTYRIQKDAMAEFGYDLKAARRGSYILNDSAAVWFPNLVQSEEDIANRGFGNIEIDPDKQIVEIASDDKLLGRILNGSCFQRIAFPRGKGEDYHFGGLYKFDGADKANRRVTWKRIAAEINTADYPVIRRGGRQ